MSERFEPRAGPLTAVAQRFAERYGLDPTLRSRAALKALAGVLDRYAFNEVEATEDELIEEGGAYLGLLLLEEYEGCHRARNGKNRVRLGTHGYFDPFAAIEAALAADDPIAELRARIQMADAEARGRGPTSRVLTEFEGILRPLGLTIIDQFEFEITLDSGAEVDLARVARATESQPIESVRAAVAKFAALLGGAESSPASWEDVRDQVLPRLVPENFLTDLEETALARYPFAADVHTTYVVAHSDRSRFIRDSELVQWDVAPDEARQVAISNLAARSHRARFARLTTERGPLVVARSGDGLDSARLLLPGLFSVLAAELEVPIFGAIPHRDTLLATSGRDPRLLDMLEQKTREEASKAPHPISTTLFEIRPEGRPVASAKR